MDRGPMALFGAIIALGLGPAMWVGAQFGQVTLTPDRPPAVISNQQNQAPEGGSGAGDAPAGTEVIRTEPKSNNEPLKPTKNSRPVKTSPSPSASDEPSAPVDESTPPDSTDPADEETTPPTESTTPPVDPPTEDEDPDVPPEPPVQPGDDNTDTATQAGESSAV
ncbi:hypothetical protein [Actinoplanes friuliensis]|jgi:hypothetical protein|uniref:Uncharacterized protein n=1 Tax=Actinoplanes friuliensis DSM 7358 TaxID=1246995 RepID=U5VS94_9ACTN|nr:hypothetical protein [Actinoplanes friuliensis]AGZ39677.1 hypothetical protein AFR_06940 [Actinoplanes friuliensis DSM 7358]